MNAAASQRRIYGVPSPTRPRRFAIIEGVEVACGNYQHIVFLADCLTAKEAKAGVKRFKALVVD